MEEGWADVRKDCAAADAQRRLRMYILDEMLMPKVKTDEQAAMAGDARKALTAKGGLR